MWMLAPLSKRWPPVLVAVALVTLVAEALAAPVLLPGSEGPLKEALEGEGPLDGRLVLQGAAIDKDRVEVRFGATLEGVTSLEVDLGWPGAADAKPPFTLKVTSAPVDEAALAALRARLEGLDGAALWGDAQEPEIDSGEQVAVEVADRREEAERALRDALHLLKVDGPRAAKAALAELREDAELAAAAGLELSVALHRAGDHEVAHESAGAWRAPEEPISNALLLRRDVLAGEAPDVVARAAALNEEDRCALGSVAQALDAAGRRAEGYTLLEAASRPEGCPGPDLQRADWLVSDRRIEEADGLTQALLRAHDQSDEVRARRAQVLMAQGKPREASAALEPVAWEDRESGLISSLIGAYNRVPDLEWQRAKRIELMDRVAKDPGDEVAAFLSGVLLHYEGDWKGSDALLVPLLDRFGEQPRLFIYLGMNAFNLGKRDEALAHIEKARSLDAPDPDVYYCRAEIYRWSDPSAALEDLRRYLNQTKGSPTSSAQKRARVETMAELLGACVEAGAPIPCVGPWEHPRGDPANTLASSTEGGGPTPLVWGLIALGALALLGLGAALLRRR